MIWEAPLPNWKIVIPCEVTEVVGRLVIVYGWFLPPTGWFYALTVWGSPRTIKVAATVF